MNITLNLNANEYAVLFLMKLESSTMFLTILFFGAKFYWTSAVSSAPPPAPVQGGGGGSMLGGLGATIAQGEFTSTCTFFSYDK